MIRIGVTGHRYLADVERVRAAVRTALQRIASRHPGQSMTVVSSLAEGADRLVAEEAMAALGAGLIVPLPLPREEYEKDFASPASRASFARLLARADEVVTLPPAPSRAAAYAAAGRYVEAASDVLLAVWDGGPSQGRAGTAEVVAAARRRGLPLAWVHAGNRRPGTTEAMSLGPEQGTVTFERF